MGRMIEEYLDLQRKYTQQYGKCVVLMECGSFYEIWEYDPKFCRTVEDRTSVVDGRIFTEHIGHAVEISACLNIHLTYENSHEVYSLRNPNKIGWPTISASKYIPILLAHDFTVIRMDQMKGAGKTMERFVAEILSPSLQLDVPITRSTSNIVCIYLEYQHSSGMPAVRGTTTKSVAASSSPPLPKFENFLITAGVAVIDVLTGTNRVCEFYSRVEDEVSALQNVFRFLIAHYPREVLLFAEELPAPFDVQVENPYLQFLEKSLELHRFDRVTTKVNSIQPDFKRVQFQIEFLNRIFSHRSRIPRSSSGTSQGPILEFRNEKIMEELNLERMSYGRISYLGLLQFIHSHSPSLLQNLSPPDTNWLDASHLQLTHNAILQLDLIPETTRRQKKGEITSLFSVLDQCQTNLGRRRLHTLIQNPMVDPKLIEDHYQMIEEFTQEIAFGDTSQPLWVTMGQFLKELPDLGRLHRKLEVGLISPKEMAAMYRGHVKIVQLYIALLQVPAPTLHQHLLKPNEVQNFNQFIARFNQILNFDALDTCWIDRDSQERWMGFGTEWPLRTGIYSELDARQTQMVIAEAELQRIVAHLNGFLKNSAQAKVSGSRSKDEPKKSRKRFGVTEVMISVTNAQAAVLMRSPIDTALCGVIEAATLNSSNKSIVSPVILNLKEIIDNGQIWLRQKLCEVWDIIIAEMNSTYFFFGPIVSVISLIDLIHTYAKVSYQNRYFRPEIVCDDGPSFLEMKDVRHPIIEKIIDGTYITNDIRLGRGNLRSTPESQSVEDGQEISEVDRSNGMLLYGLNCAGKTSLTKAISISIIMAQIGCYVPSRLRYKPFRRIITRLSGNDDLFRGESSFAIEMSELRTILRQADSGALVVGDEVTRGTDNKSGIGIISAAILELIKRQSTFIFSTHIHDIVDLPDIQALPPESLRICHLTVHKDPTTNHLIYERKLRPGSGPSTYGILVAESLGLPAEFISKAYEITNYVLGTTSNVVSPHYSRYNRDVYVNACGRCGKTRRQTTLHTHHIVEQKYADRQGIIENEIGIMHKNHRDNLIVLCEECHRTLHKTDAELETVTIPIGKIIREKETAVGV